MQLFYESLPFSRGAFSRMFLSLHDPSVDGMRLSGLRVDARLPRGNPVRFPRRVPVSSPVPLVGAAMIDLLPGDLLEKNGLPRWAEIWIIRAVPAVLLLRYIAKEATMLAAGR